MPIQFHCSNPECGRALTADEAAAGRAGTCPGCGESPVVPHPVPGPTPIATESRSEPVPRVWSQEAYDPDWDGVGSPPGGGPVVSFDAVGLAWGLMRQRMGTWVLAVVVVGLAQFGCQMLLNVLAFLGGAAEAAAFSIPFPVVTTSVAIVAGAMVQGVLLGGLYRMALKQVDGGDVSVDDVFAVGPVAPALGLVSLLTTLGIGVGLLLLIIPGLVFAGLAMFALPAAVEGLGAFGAIGRSVAALRRQWLMAPLFVAALWMLDLAGLMCLGVGVLFAVPLCVLAVAVQYRRSFAPAGVPRKAVVADPRAGAVGEPTRSGRAPAWAWGLLGLGVLASMVAFGAVMAALVIPAALNASRVAVQRDQMARARVLTKGQGGFQGGPPAPVTTRPGAAQPGPVDPVPRAIEDASRGGARRGLGVSMLYTLPVEPRHRAAVVAALTPLLGDPQLGGDAARGLSHWAGPPDVPTLVVGLDSAQPRVRFFLLQALGRLKAEAAIPALVEHLGVAEDRGMAADALRAIGPAAASEVRKLLDSDDPAIRREASSLLRQLGGDDQATRMTLALAALRSPDPSERDRALQGLGRPPAVEASRGDVLAAVGPLLEDPRPSARRAALKVVETWGTAEQSPWLVASLDDPDRSVRAAALAAIRKAPDPESALELARRLRVADRRKQAADALVAMGLKDERVEAEVHRALDDPDAATRQSACRVLRAIGTRASIPALKEAATDRVGNVATAARSALAAIDPEATPDASPEVPKTRMGPRKRR